MHVIDECDIFRAQQLFERTDQNIVDTDPHRERSMVQPAAGGEKNMERRGAVENRTVLFGFPIKRILRTGDLEVKSRR